MVLAAVAVALIVANVLAINAFLDSRYAMWVFGSPKTFHIDWTKPVSDQNVGRYAFGTDFYRLEPERVEMTLPDGTPFHVDHIQFFDFSVRDDQITHMTIDLKLTDWTGATDHVRSWGRQLGFAPTGLDDVDLSADDSYPKAPDWQLEVPAHGVTLTMDVDDFHSISHPPRTETDLWIKRETDR